MYNEEIYNEEMYTLTHAIRSCTPLVHSSPALLSCTPLMHSSHAHNQCCAVQCTQSTIKKKKKAQGILPARQYCGAILPCDEFPGTILIPSLYSLLTIIFYTIHSL
jgi:hypothetical protein